MWLDSYFCTMCDSDYITPLSAGTGRGSIWKASRVQIPLAKNALLVGSALGPSQR